MPGNLPVVAFVELFERNLYGQIVTLSQLPNHFTKRRRLASIIQRQVSVDPGSLSELALFQPECVIHSLSVHGNVADRKGYSVQGYKPD